MIPITRAPYASAAVSNSTSIEGRANRIRSSTESAKRAVLDEQVIVGRRDVDVSWLDVHLVLGIEHETSDLRAVAAARARPPANRGGDAGRSRSGRSMSAGKVTEYPTHRVETAPRCADADQVVHALTDLPIELLARVELLVALRVRAER